MSHLPDISHSFETHELNAIEEVALGEILQHHEQ